MKTLENLVEYYDELFVISDAQKAMYGELCASFKQPARLLRVCCGSGLFETLLAREGCDVTGIDSSDEFLKIANLRHRSQLMALRFFQMDVGDMTKFLGKSFYNVVSILESRLLFLGGKPKLKRFFADCNQLLSDGGVLVVEAMNFTGKDKKFLVQLPVKESLRAKLFADVLTGEGGQKLFSMNLETGNGKLLPVVKAVPVCPLLPDEVIAFAKEAGFQNARVYSGWDKLPFKGDEESFVALFEKHST